LVRIGVLGLLYPGAESRRRIPFRDTSILVSSDIRTAPHHADLPVAFEHRKRDVGDVPDVAVEPQVFQNVMFAEPISPCELLIQCSLANDDVEKRRVIHQNEGELCGDDFA
jgi:hypothetical protein